MSENPTARSQEWLDYARADLTAARVLRHAPEVSLAITCFHTQQCAEKALKAVLVQHEIAFPRTHIIERLLDLLLAAEVKVPARVNEAFVLTQYAVEARYPGHVDPIALDEADNALNVAAEVLAWAEAQYIATHESRDFTRPRGAP